MQREPDDTTELTGVSRRSMMKAAGVAGAASVLGFSGTAGARASTPTVDAGLDTSGGLQEVLVVFETNADVDHLRHLDFEHDLAGDYHKFAVLPVGYTALTGDQIRTVAGWSDVRFVEANKEIEYHNDDAREVTGVKETQEERFYTGESVHAVAIDSGIDGDHPDHEDGLQHNFRFVDPLDRETMWVDAGPANTGGTGHGTHVSGTIAGDGSQSDGQYRGMAPDADLTVYSTTGGAFLFNIVGAYDHMIDRQRQGKHDVQVVNNSYGAGVGGDYNPNGALETATYMAFEEGILPVFSAGNSGPDSNTYSDYAAGPHVLGVAATDDRAAVTDFSSRGRKPSYDGGGEGAHYDRQAAFENLQDFYASGLDQQPVVGEETYSGTVGPGSSDAGVGQSAYEEWTSPDDAGFVEAEISWTPQGQDLDIYLHEGAKDGPVVASAASLANPELLSGGIDPGTTYFFEVRPFANVTASYTIDLAAREALPASEQPSGPYGIYRNGVGATGDFVLSTLAPGDPLQGYAGVVGAPERQDTETFYGVLSGTSMSGPTTAGICALVYDAYFQTTGEFPDPIDVINTVEATADDGRAGHNVYNIGTGFVDADAAVERAAADDLAGFDEVTTADYASAGDAPEPVFAPTGSRADDGSVFTAGQTNQVDITVDAIDTAGDDAATVRDAIPFGWGVVAGDSNTVYTENGSRYIEFDEPASAGETRTYFVEAPDATGSYEFGPAEAAPVGDSVFVRVVGAGAETNEVAGLST
jgi:serine protease AprX